jgi:methyl-accepting chemotaxis protein
MPRLSNIRMSYKIAAMGAVGILGLLLVGAIYLIGSGSQSRYQRIADDASDMRSTAATIQLQLLQLRRHEKDLLLRKNDQYAKAHAETAKAAVMTFDFLTKQLADMGQNQLVSDVKALQAGYDVYAKSFLALVDLQHKLGLTADTGLEGTLRTSVHEIESSLAGFKDSSLNELMLMMRRHEKDYMLRRDLQYRDQFKKAVTTFAEALAASVIPASAKNDISKKLSAYQSDFLAYVDEMQSLVTKQTEMSAAYAKIEPSIDAIAQETTKLKVDAGAAAVTARDSTAQMFVIAALLIIVSAAIFAFFVGRGITRPIAVLVGLLEKLAGGDYGVEINGTDRKDEIGDIAKTACVFNANGLAKIRMEQEKKEAEGRAAAERDAAMQKMDD